MEKSLSRCPWCEGDALYKQYHDKEWGVPVFDDLKLFEILTLETFQAGLSWITILRKKEYFKMAFDQFDYEKVAQYGDEKINALFNNKSIIRNNQKIEAAVNNAQRFICIIEKYRTFSQYIWGFVGGKPLQNGFKTLEEIPTKTALSERISKDLKENGFQFIGPKLVYAFMQAMGMVNDHLLHCYRYSELSHCLRKADHHPAHR